MEQPLTYENDLVFTILGGHRHGAQIQVKARKSILALEDGAGDSENEQSLCAIYRGPAGTVIRNLEDEILVNNQPKTTHWLEAGDLIQFPNSVTLQVTQLGTIEEDEVSFEQQEAQYLDTNQLLENSPMASEDSGMDTSLKTEEQSSGDCEDADADVSDKDNQDFHSQYETLSKRIDDLAEQVSELVSLASSGQIPLTPTVETPEQNEMLQDTDRFSRSFCPAEVFPTTQLEESSEPMPLASDLHAEATSTSETSNIDQQFNPSWFGDDEPISDPGESVPSPLAGEDEVANEFSPVTLEENKARTDEALDDLLKRLLNENSLAQDEDEIFENHSTNTDSSISNVASSIENDSNLSSFFFDEPTDPSVPTVANSNEQFSNSTLAPASNVDSTSEMELPTQSEPESESSIHSLAEQILHDISSEPKASTVDSDQIYSAPDESLNQADEPITEGSIDEASQAGVSDNHSSGLSMVSDIDQTETTSQEVSDPDSVEDYMNQLLARMNFGKAAGNQTAPSNSSSRQQTETKEDLGDDEQAEEHNFMNPEEFIPKRKAQKIESLSTMRDIANTTARSAVAYSDYSRQKTRCLMQLIIAFGAAIMAIYYFAGVMASLGDTAFWVGSFCFAISGVLCFLSFKTLAKQKSVFSYIFSNTEKNKL